MLLTTVLDKKANTLIGSMCVRFLAKVRELPLYMYMCMTNLCDVIIDYTVVL